MAYYSLFSNQPAEYKVVPASFITATSGTGIVHCAPAHGVEDYHALQSLGLLPHSAQMTCHVDLAGKFTEKVVEVVGEEHGRKLVGLEVLNEGGMQIVEILRSKVDFGARRLIKEEKIKHRYPYDWRTGKPVIVLSVSSQVIVIWSLTLVACSGQLSSGSLTSKV